jgi:hypothetical protein
MGIDEGMRHDVALISSSQIDEGQPLRSYLVAALSEGYDISLGETPEHPAHAIHAQIGQVVLDYANRA